MREQVAVNQALPSPGGRGKFALLLLGLAIVSFLLAPFVMASDLPRQVRGGLGALLMFGLPMALVLAIVALVGQPAFVFFKRMSGQASPPAEVASTRYRIGALLVWACILLSWLEPFLSSKLEVLDTRRFLFGGLADALVLVGLCLLGGAFWDKLHALFVQESRVVPPDDGPVEASAELVEIGWRFWVGVAMLGSMVVALCLIPLASSMGRTTAEVAKLTGIVLIANKVLLFGAIAVMGKSGYNHLKGIVGGFLGKFAPARQVSPGRYQLGLVLFLVPIFMTWIQPYITGFLMPGSVWGFLQELALELLIVIGLFMLGGEFWDKFKALFNSRAKVEFPGRTGRLA
ncbi:MAG TPA: hypothetical protein VK981_03605 [Ramlibacter sp.]|nr:hypothetical protein [Ramlibacter sp.]